MRFPELLIAALPSPSTGSFHLGPLQINAYGLLVASGVLAAVWLTTRRWEALGRDPEEVQTVVLWAVPAGVLGARLYHVITDYPKYVDDPVQALMFWKGGLGIWGGIAVGALVGVAVCRRKGIPAVAFLDAAAPGLALGQAIGRWGNWFNQELFGRPTDLPWGLRIDENHRPGRYLEVETFHPTFLYESLWNFALALTLIVVGRRLSLRPGQLFALYAAGYTFARFFIEGLRVDPAPLIGALRLNQWTSLVVFSVAVITYWYLGRRYSRSDNGQVLERH